MIYFTKFTILKIGELYNYKITAIMGLDLNKTCSNYFQRDPFYSCLQQLHQDWPLALSSIQTFSSKDNSEYYNLITFLKTPLNKKKQQLHPDELCKLSKQQAYTSFRVRYYYFHIMLLKRALPIFLGEYEPVNHLNMRYFEESILPMTKNISVDHYK